MEDESVWPPPPKNQVSYHDPAPKQSLFVRVALLAVGVGFVLGLLDVCRSDSLADWLTFGMAVVLGFLHPKSFLVSAFILSLCLYLVHVAAIQHGIRQPYVERNVDSAMNCWQSVFPNALGGLIGAVIKAFEQYGHAGPTER